MSIDPVWVSAFADTPPAGIDDATAFWSAVAGTVVGEPIGDDREFVPFRPHDGEPFLWIQRTQSDVSRWHADLYVVDLAAASASARSLGATVVRSAAWWVTLRSPSGLEFCLIDDDRAVHPLPAARTWPDGHRSRVDQVCLDIPHENFDDECRFWAELTGWELRDSPRSPFRYLERPDRMPIRFLLQPLGAEDLGPIRAHVDLATDDRSAEIERHRELGAEPVSTAEWWTVMAAPGGHTYCITERSP